jgi:hypothetical protein
MCDEEEAFYSSEDLSYKIWKYVKLEICKYVKLSVWESSCVYVYIHTYMYTYIRICIHAYIHTYRYDSLRHLQCVIYIYACIHTYWRMQNNCTTSDRFITVQCRIFAPSVLFLTFTTSSNLQRWKTNHLKRSLVVQLFCIRQYVRLRLLICDIVRLWNGRSASHFLAAAVRAFAGK